MAFPALAAAGFGVKLVSGLFGESQADRIRKARQRLEQQKTGDISRAYGRTSRLTSQRIASARQRAGEQAAALGRPQDVGQFLIPMESNITTAGSQMTGNALENINQDYGRRSSQLDYAEATADESTPLDFLGEAGGALANYAIGQEGLDQMYPKYATEGEEINPADVASTGEIWNPAYPNPIWGMVEDKWDDHVTMGYRYPRRRPLDGITPLRRR
jgi:hypothetical protein